jgi:hypothetical protein
VTINIEQMRADMKWEPWKALSAAFGASIAVASGLIALAAYIIAHVAR